MTVTTILYIFITCISLLDKFFTEEYVSNLKNYDNTLNKKLIYTKNKGKRR